MQNGNALYADTSATLKRAIPREVFREAPLLNSYLMNGCVPPEASQRICLRKRSLT